MKTIYYLFEIGIDIPMYVGLTKQPLRNRLRSHRCSKGDVRREVWIRKAMAGGGLGIKTIEVVEEAIAIEREEYWTKFYMDDGGLTNMRIGAKGTLELNEKMSVSAKKKTINWDQLRKVHDGNRGRKMSESVCEKRRKPVVVNGTKYKSISEAVKITKVPSTTLRSYLSGKNKSEKYIVTPA